MAERILKGIGVSEGIRIGKALVYQHESAIDTDRFLHETEIPTELERLQTTVEQAQIELDALIIRSAQTLSEDKLGVLKGQKSMLADPAFLPEMKKLIQKKLFSPEKAVKQVAEQFAAIFENMKNTYMQERAADVRDAGNRLLAILCGGSRLDLSAIQEPVILVADDLSPTETVQLDKNVVLAFVTEKGGVTSHTSIFARSLAIPAVVGMENAVDVMQNGDVMIVDGKQGVCIVHPEPETIAAYQEKMQAEQKEQAMFQQYLTVETETADGYRLQVGANIGSAKDAAYAVEQGSEGVGLFRTESIYFARDTLPSEDEQFAEYQKVAQLYQGKEVILRTLDVGGDKPIKAIPIALEENPFLGYRAIRVCLEQKELFLTQLRAILRASAFGKLKIMFPMISGVEELLAAKKMLEEAKAQLQERQIAYDEQIQVGIMIEIPSAAVMADLLAKEVDFFSIGTNDLIQYTLAADRGNEKVAYLYDYCNPAILRLIKMVSDAAHAEGIPVGVCGNMGAETDAVALHIGLQMDEISMPASRIPQIKHLVHRQNTQECKKLVEQAIRCRTAKEVHALLQNFASEKRE